MRAISIIFKRELAAYLRSPIGYVIASLLLLVCGILFQSKALGEGKQLSAVVLQHFFEFSSGTTPCVAFFFSTASNTSSNALHGNVSTFAPP